jgi:16S rRNA (cytidine1402-2'-O)-methyltransferase
MSGQLILLPNALDAQVASKQFLPPILEEVVPTLSGLIAESEKGARLFLKRFSYEPPKSFREVPIYLLNEHSSPEDLQELLNLVKSGGVWGLISDCGLPILADPGSQLVSLARREKISIQAYLGPSSIILTLMVSGFSGQQFTFHGYLPRDLQPLKKKIELIGRLKDQTHLFIEAPYRTQKLLEILLKELDPNRHLCVAANLTLPEEQIIVQSVKEWRKGPLPPLNKQAAVFAIS